MTATRRAIARFHPLFLSILVAAGAVTLFTTLVAALAPASLPVTASAAPAQLALADDTPVEAAPGVVLVKLKPGAAEALAGQRATAAQPAQDQAAVVARLFQFYGVTDAEPLLGAQPALAAAAGAEPGALANVYRLHLATQFDAEQMALALAADPSVEYAEPDYLARPTRIPNDPEYASQWAFAKIGAPVAWDVQTGSPDVVIAVIDSGVDLAHPEFSSRLWENDDPVDGVDNDLNGFVDDSHGWNVLAKNSDLGDANGHGTQVGGVLGAATDNGAGVAGLCWNCRLMFVNAMQANGVTNYSDIAQAVQYAASNGAQVINLSLGGYADSALLSEAIQEASTTAVIVAGAGNDDNSNPFYPAAYPQVLAVAATDQNNQKAVFSNDGAWVDLAAPGVDIRTTTLAGYATDGGSSLSTAFVAGLAGLVKSQHPQWTPEQVKWQLLNTAVDIDAANPARIGQLGAGRIDAAAALATDPQAQAAVESYTMDGAANGRPAPGQSFSLVLTLQNQWLPAQNLRGTLTSSDPHVTITGAAGVFGDIASGRSASNAASPFAVTVSGSAAYNAQLGFTLNLSGDGGYSLAVPFALQVRSSVETLGNTQYTQDTTWTNDKSYVLAGSVIVGQGVTLTIQPGTVVKADPGKFIRIDGTLIAAGTAEQPIVLTANSATQEKWAGLRFGDSAVDAAYTGRDYAAGSALQYAHISFAEIGVNLGTRSPYIADGTFTNNNISVQIGSNNTGGSPVIERNMFAGGGSVNYMPSMVTGTITLSGGQPLIRDNRFDAAFIAIGGDGQPQIRQNTFRNIVKPAISLSGSPVLVGNIFENNRREVIDITCCGSNAPVIHDNVLVNNGAGLSAYNLLTVTIGHNLIANNGGNACDYPLCSGEEFAMRLTWGGAYPASLASEIYSNTIINNRGPGIKLGGWEAGSVKIDHNNLIGNGAYDIDLIDGSAGTQNFTVDASNNFWSVPDSAIAGRIHDCTFDDNGCGTAGATLGQVAYTPTLAEPEQAAPAFARSASMNPNPVGLQAGAITVDLSRPMDTNVLPTASFHDSRRGATQIFSDTNSSSMAQDSLGRMWFGVGSELRMYNGRQWQTYSPAQGLGGGRVSALLAAANGDLWVGHADGEVALSRLRGSTWTTYTRQISDTFRLGLVSAISDDGAGNLWIIDAMHGLFRFNGAQWLHIGQADGLAGETPHAIVRSRDGHIWVKSMDGSGGGVSEFDGIQWKTYDQKNGLPPPTALGNLFADSQGRIWVSSFVSDANSVQVAMFSAGSWRLFSRMEVGGQVGGELGVFAESSNGDVWLSDYYHTAIYQDGSWRTVAATSYGPAMVFDSRDNLWYVTETGSVAVHWGGLDYAFENGRWLSSTRFAADYTFTPNVPPGSYVVELAGVVDSDSMSGYAQSNSAFTVDFGAGVTLDPPGAPSVIARTSGSLSNLSATWQNSSPNIDQYRYAIGTSAGARDVVGWTYQTGASFVRDNLSLVPGQVYYVTVQARNAAGLWSVNGISNRVVGGAAAATGLYMPLVKR